MKLSNLNNLMSHFKIRIRRVHSISFCFNGELDKFNKRLRWKSRKECISTLGRDNVIDFYCHLWTKGGKDIKKDSGKTVSVGEQYL